MPKVLISDKLSESAVNVFKKNKIETEYNPGLRIWGGPTVENDDVKNLLPWLDWAYYETLDQLKI